MMPGGGNLALVGVLRVTNSGPVTIYIWDFSHGGIFSTNNLNNFPIRNWYKVPIIPSRVMSPNTGPQILEPGKALDVEMYVGPAIESWSVDALISRWGPKERICHWAYLTGNSTLQQWVEDNAPRQELLIIPFGPITNQVPTNIWKPFLKPDGDK